MAERVEIRGGADAYVTAAVIAVIAALEAEEAALRSRPVGPRRPSAWVLAGLPTDPDDPFDEIVPEPAPGR